MSDTLNMNFLPQETTLSRLMQEARDFVAEAEVRGDYITTGVVFAVLLKDQNVKKFISAQTGRSMAEMDHLSVAAEQNAISRIKGLQPKPANQLLPPDSSPQEIGLYPVWDNGFRSFYSENVERLKTPLEILVAMAVSLQAGISGIESFDSEFKRFNLKNLHEDLLMKEYGAKSYVEIVYKDAKPSGRALAFAREFEAGDAQALSPRDHWYATNATQEGSPKPAGENANADGQYSVQAVARALQIWNQKGHESSGSKAEERHRHKAIHQLSLKAKAFRSTSGRRER